MGLSGSKRGILGRRLSQHHPRMIDAISTEIFYRYGLDDPNGTGLYLVRPDGHIAFQTSGLRVSEFQKFLARFSAGKMTGKTAA